MAPLQWRVAKGPFTKEARVLSGQAGHTHGKTPLPTALIAVWDPKVCVPKMAQINTSFCKYHSFPL